MRETVIYMYANGKTFLKLIKARPTARLSFWLLISMCYHPESTLDFLTHNLYLTSFPFLANFVLHLFIWLADHVIFQSYIYPFAVESQLSSS